MARSESMPAVPKYFALVNWADPKRVISGSRRAELYSPSTLLAVAVQKRNHGIHIQRTKCTEWAPCQPTQREREARHCGSTNANDSAAREAIDQLLHQQSDNGQRQHSRPKSESLIGENFEGAAENPSRKRSGTTQRDQKGNPESQQ